MRCVVFASAKRPVAWKIGSGSEAQATEGRRVWVRGFEDFENLESIVTNYHAFPNIRLAFRRFAYLFCRFGLLKGTVERVRGGING